MTLKDSLENKIEKEHPLFIGMPKQIKELEKDKKYKITYEDYFNREQQKTITINFKIHPQTINGYVIRGSVQEQNREKSYVLEIIDGIKLEEYLQKTSKQERFKTTNTTDYGCFLKYVNPINGT